MILGVVVGGALYFVNDSFLMGRKMALNERYVFQAGVMASNIVEVGKHLMLHENYFFLDDPFNYDKDRIDTIVRLWEKGFGSVGNDTEMAKACGGFDAKGRPLSSGTILIAGQEVPIFCPYLIRSDQITGIVLEKIIFDGILKNNKYFQKVADGHYQLSIPLFNLDKNINVLVADASRPSIVDLGVFEDLLENIQNRELVKEINLKFEFFTDSSGFKSSDGVRQIKISSNIEFSSKVANRHIQSESTFLLYPSVLRDFAISIIWPRDNNGLATDELHKALVVKNASNTQIRGRVLFNGNININELEKLPRFKEIVVISGNLVGAEYLDDKQQEIFRDKFAKGLISGLSAPRYLFSGNCSDSNIKVINQTGFYCKTTSGDLADISIYKGAIDSCSSASGSKIAYNNRFASYCVGGSSGCAEVCGCDSESECGDILKGVFVEKNIPVEAIGDRGFFSVVLQRADIDINIVYGNIFAGHVELGDNFESWVAMESIEVGEDPSVISSSEVLNNYNNRMAAAANGLLVNLTQVPTLVLMEEAFK
jgi:hypothetical protein